jgi:hypothetical protein
MQQDTQAQQTRSSETKVKQGGPPRVTLWVLLASIVLAALVGAALLTNTDEYPPSTQRNPVENQPVSGSQPAPPAGEPQTRQ